MTPKPHVNLKKEKRKKTHLNQIKLKILINTSKIWRETIFFRQELHWNLQQLFVFWHLLSLVLWATNKQTKPKRKQLSSFGVPVSRVSLLNFESIRKLPKKSTSVGLWWGSLVFLYESLWDEFDCSWIVSKYYLGENLYWSFVIFNT